MSLERDISELKKTFESHLNERTCPTCNGTGADPVAKLRQCLTCMGKGVIEAKIQEEKPVITAEPGTETEPAIPAAPQRERPEKPRTPIRPMPGITPKPKAFSTDVDLFLKRRGLHEGRMPMPDDEERANCTKAGELGHFQCGIYPEHKKPRFECGCFYRKDAKKNESRINEADPLKGVHPAKKAWIQTGDEELNKILPELSAEEQRYLVTIASETYKETVRKVQEYTGIEVKPTNYPALVQLMIQTLQEAQQFEEAHTQQLEELALDLIFSVPEFKIVEEAYLNDELGFDIKLGTPDLSKLVDQEQETPEEGLAPDEELNMALAGALQDMSDEDLRRRFANLMITGGSVNKLYLFNMASDKLARINPALPTAYGILASMAQLGYWITPFGIEQAAAGGGDTSAGSEEVVPEGDKYVIKARGTTFPYLMHEIVKGVYEYLALDPSQQIAMGKAKVEDETKDMLAGPGVYKAIASYIPADRQELLPIVQKKLTAMGAEEIRDILASNPNGRKIMDRLIGEAEKELADYRKQKEEYQA